MKTFTDIKQSKKLADILPIESADMWWNFYSVTTDDTTPQIIHLDTPWVGNFNWDNKPDNVPCWSLAALINAMPKIQGDKAIIYLYDNYVSYTHLGINAQASNLVDACYEMIINLNEQKLL